MGASPLLRPLAASLCVGSVAISSSGDLETAGGDVDLSVGRSSSFTDDDSSCSCDDPWSLLLTIQTSRFKCVAFQRRFSEESLSGSS